MAKKVLVVEDYDDSREFMKFLLESYGYTVIEAVNGIEAVDKVKEYHPDLVLMDISLPVVDGLTATRTIRSFNNGLSVPIIAVTAFGNDYRRKAMEAGCNDFIDKPVDFNELEPLLHQYLDH